MRKPYDSHATRRSALFLAVGTATLLALAGCANPLTNPNFSPGAGAGAGASTLGPGAGAGIGGQVSVGALPPNFPADDIPVVDGEVLAGTTSSDPTVTNWMFAVVMSDPSNPADVVSAQFSSKGFSAVDLNSAGNRFGSFDGSAYDIVGGSASGFTKDRYSVMVTTGVDHQGRTIAAYIVRLDA